MYIELLSDRYDWVHVSDQNPLSTKPIIVFESDFALYTLYITYNRLVKDYMSGF